MHLQWPLKSTCNGGRLLGVASAHERIVDLRSCGELAQVQHGHSDLRVGSIVTLSEWHQGSQGSQIPEPALHAPVTPRLSDPAAPASPRCHVPGPGSQASPSTQWPALCLSISRRGMLESERKPAHTSGCCCEALSFTAHTAPLTSPAST